MGSYGREKVRRGILESLLPQGKGLAGDQRRTVAVEAVTMCAPGASLDL
jgi:hypothetical protein